MIRMALKLVPYVALVALAWPWVKQAPERYTAWQAERAAEQARQEATPPADASPLCLELGRRIDDHDAWHLDDKAGWHLVSPHLQLWDAAAPEYFDAKVDDVVCLFSLPEKTYLYRKQKLLAESVQRRQLEELRQKLLSK